MFSHRMTYCSNCDYQEPGGSAHFVTFTIDVLCVFLKNLSIEKISIGGEETTDFRGVLDAQSVLPAVLINTQLNTRNIGSEFNAIPLTTVNDKNGYYQRRVITTSNNITNPSLILSGLAETLYATYLLTKERNHDKRNTINLNLLSPISAIQNKSIQSYANNEHSHNGNQHDKGLII